MLDAIKELHELEYIHLKLDPDNFRVRKSGVVMLLNFNNAVDLSKNNENGKHNLVNCEIRR